MKLHTFTNIGGFPWLAISLLANDTAEAVKKFNTIWGTNIRYTVTTGPVGIATQTLV